ncbi:MAG TPA: decarboxylating 6-phosphogluconate dehydrogenase [Candidatus Babeliales bacterium]|nr:decarboxylating 6-phosphogluconate dehydrogenase [Candidatus Babeliales bacterium]
MKLGIIGLGRMGLAIAQRSLEGAHEVVGFDFSADACRAAQQAGVQIVESVEAVARATDIVWLMVPAGDPVDQVIAAIKPVLRAGAIIVDGGNSNFSDSIRRYADCAKDHVAFLDCGTSGGLRGRDVGFSLMIGGDKTAYETLITLFTAIAAPHGFALVGPAGAGHYVKMVHNGIEYGLMQAYAEGFHLIKDGSFKADNLDLEQITTVWNNGSVIRSFLLELAHDIFKKDQQLDAISGSVDETGMGKWTVDDAHKHAVPVPVIEQSLVVRAQSRKTGGNYGTKVVAMLRKAFGGHAVKQQ